MTTGPKLRLDSSLAPGVLAVALFVIMATIVLNTGFSPEMEGFEGVDSITAEIGYAMFDLEALQSTEGSIPDTEAFLAAFLLIAVALDAALDASLVLAKREEEGEPVAALASRGTGSDGAGSAASGVAGSDRSAATDGGHEGSTVDADRADDPGGESR
ncbi:hypothetical protein [Natrarchaeobius oligotrophus]|uniref:Proton-conducting membrane transporter n=1 Tax=Natrarchaeobius chitinivorans TaxID=1679083 RepID=A0A3N6PGV5_NATCH|nr:hypothetical protein [Natrarchaeobius chitinivorans]RQG99619.1 hypothetical protein EA472_13210 [Natrarchaeobius chitinivorans]